MKRALRTGVGSLPHLSLDAAIEYAFRFDLPFVPQLPALNPNERMVFQALTGLIGFHVLPGSDPAEAVYREEAHETTAAIEQDARIQQALSQIEASLSLRPIEEFLPSQDIYRALRPFVWESSERGIEAIKIQIAGPWTCLETLISASGKRSESLSPHAQKRILSFCLVRAVALIRYLHESGIQPWLFIDEPYLFTLQPKAQPQHAAFLQELTAFTKTLRDEAHRARGKLGLHCCSDPVWNDLLGTTTPPPLHLDFISIDAQVSGHSLSTQAAPALLNFERHGGSVIWGVIPSNLSLADTVIPQIEGSSSSPSTASPSTASPSTASPSKWISPACGLAYHTPLEAEEVWERLMAYPS